MNFFFFAILTILVIEYALDLLANLLNIKALKPYAPTSLQDVYKPSDYKRSQQYTRVQTLFALTTGAFKLGLLLIFWFIGGFNSLDQMVRNWGYGEIVNGLLYIGILLVCYALITMPFSLYATFGIEDRFGFNKMSPRTFILDQVKGLILLTVIGGPLLAGVLAFFEYAGPLAWLTCWATATFFILSLQFIAPTWIMPLFNKLTPMGPGELRDSIYKYAHSVNFKVGDILVMDGSKRTSKANAFFTGFGRNKRIVLFDTLIKNHTVPELVAVLAHEIGHYKKNHLTQRIVVNILQMGILFFLMSIILKSPELYEAFFLNEKSIYCGLLFFGLLYTPVEMVLSIAMLAVSRRHEFESDRWATETTADPSSLVNALKKLSTNNLDNLAPHPLYILLNHTHPTLHHRIQAIIKRRSIITQVQDSS